MGLQLTLVKVFAFFMVSEVVELVMLGLLESPV